MGKIKLEDLLNDNRSGSLDLTEKMLELFQNVLNEGITQKADSEELYKHLQNISKNLIKKQPNMALLRRVSATYLLYFKRLINSDKTPDEVFSLSAAKIDLLKDEIKSNVNKIAQFGCRIIANGNKIMTISQSRHIVNILLAAHKSKRRFEVFCLKSHPPDEGIEMAEFLASKGIKVTVIADNNMGVFMPQMNLVLIGADRIYETGIINKAGTLPLCLTAKHFNIPVYLAAETEKVLLESERSIKKSSYAPEEVYNGKAKGVSAQNIYFERIPLDLIHKVICEDSVFESYEFKNWYLGG
ncbi:MAG TPA: hypothetical protein ENK44_13300 [Caldithrix abyssi]|uniref:Translation initiation factor eIF-2B n=1 Tax=Caldithrix abyssi TaxID=187145 RepID=A0A7V4U2E7_CALAY|nr:hypothetical protein [Caldithrix abyssi]